MTQTTEIAPHEEPKALRPPTLAEELWPHAAEQQEKSFLFVERIKWWVRLIDEKIPMIKFYFFLAGSLCWKRSTIFWAVR